MSDQFDLHNRAIARLEAQLSAAEQIRQLLQQYVDGDGCEYADDAPECPGDPPYVGECRWHEATRVLAQYGTAAGIATPPTYALVPIEDERAALRAALQGLLDEPYGCAFCDCGKLRRPDNPAKGHDADCPYEVAQTLLKERV